MVYTLKVEDEKSLPLFTSFTRYANAGGTQYSERVFDMQPCITAKHMQRFKNYFISLKEL